MTKTRKTICKRFKLSLPKGKKNKKIKYTKAGGNHLITNKSPTQRRRVKDKSRVLKKSVAKKYIQLIS